MFIGVFTRPGESRPEGYIYFTGSAGRAAFIRDTWDPDTVINEILPLNITGHTYQERKASARQLAIDYQTGPAGDIPWSYGELAEIQSFFTAAGRRYGLLTEFHENAIC